MIDKALFDLDGVLAQFVRGALKEHCGDETGNSGYHAFQPYLEFRDIPWDFPVLMGFKSSHDPKFWAPLDFEFWYNLKQYADGFVLLRAVESLIGKENIGLLSTPCNTGGCRDGKAAWVRRYLPDYEDRLFLGKRKAFLAHSGALLIDDNDDNCAAWVAAGGLAYTPSRPWNQYRHLVDKEGNFDPVAESLDLAAYIREHS